MSVETSALPSERRLHGNIPPQELERLAAELGPEPARCLVCPAAAPRRLFFRDGKWFWICRRCELVWVHDIYPEYLTDVAYLDEPSRYDPNQGPKPKQLADYTRLLASFEPWRRTGCLVEVGCSVGLFLESAVKAGWRACGVEILPTVALAAREQRGLDVRTGDLIQARFPSQSFDVLYLNEVIEHVIDPVELMREAGRVLRPGGLAVLRTGNARSWSARWRGARWQYYHFGGHDHIRYWSPGAGRALAEASGFELVAAETKGFAFRESREMRGRWYKPLLKLAQGVVAPLAGPLCSGQRLTLRMQSRA